MVGSSRSLALITSLIAVGIHRPILSVQSSTLQWNLTAATSGFLSQEICPNLEKWRPDSESSKLCPHELWVVLNLDENQWKNFDKFTLRLSWPTFVSYTPRPRLLQVAHLMSRIVSNGRINEDL